MQIIPAVLENNFSDFSRQIDRLKNISSLIQIDVMDGFFVPGVSFTEVGDINDLDAGIEYELHLMTKHPLEEIQKWKKINNIFRVIFHIESDDNAAQVIEEIKNCGWKAGLAINPETELGAIEPYLNQVQEVLFLTVHPGEQGAKFLPEVGVKIEKLTKQADHPLIGVDGGINEGNIAQIKSWGAEIFCVGSALTKSENPKFAFNKLNDLIQ